MNRAKRHIIETDKNMSREYLFPDETVLSNYYLRLARNQSQIGRNAEVEGYSIFDCFVMKIKSLLSHNTLRYAHNFA